MFYLPLHYWVFRVLVKYDLSAILKVIFPLKLKIFGILPKSKLFNWKFKFSPGALQHWRHNAFVSTSCAVLHFHSGLEFNLRTLVRLAPSVRICILFVT